MSSGYSLIAFYHRLDYSVSRSNCLWLHFKVHCTSTSCTPVFDSEYQSRVCFLFHCNVSTHYYSLYTAICASQTFDIEHFTHKVRQGYTDLTLKFVHRCVLPTGTLHAVILLILCR